MPDGAHNLAINGRNGKTAVTEIEANEKIIC